MSATENPDTAGGQGGRPAVRLGCRYDDPEDPSELTVFRPGSPATTTEWLTVDRATAVPLDEMR